MNIKRITACLLTFVLIAYNVAAIEPVDEPGKGVLHVGEETVATEETAVEETTAEIQIEEKVVFSDIPEGSVYAEAVEKLVSNGVLNGYEDGTFRPDNGVTRAEMCKMINLTFGYTDVTDAKGFPDVTENDWFFPYALAAQKKGYVEGYEDDTFRGKNNITRQEVCVILARLFDFYDLKIDMGITDEVSDWAKDAVNLIVVNQLMPLEEGNTFRATEIIKRYELASVLANFIVEPVKPLTADVRFFVNGVQLGETDVIMIGECATVPENPTPSDESYFFDGWRVVGTQDVTDVASLIVTENVDYEAVFLKKTFAVEFYNGTILCESQTVEYGLSPKAPETNPTVDGYDFLGWGYSTSETVKLEEIKVYDKVVLYAVFKKTSTGGGGGGGGGTTSNYYDVNFYVLGELYDTQSVLQNKTAKTPKEPEVEGYVFEGWSLSDDGETVSVTSVKINDDTDFYAVIYKNPNDPEMLDKLNRGITQLNAVRVTVSQHRTLKSKLLSCMRLVYADAKSGIYVDQDYVNEEYEEEIADVEDFVNNEMTVGQATEFKGMLENNIDEDVRDFLREYFLKGVDI